MSVVTAREIEMIRERLHSWAVWRVAESRGAIGPSPGMGQVPWLNAAKRETPRLSEAERQRLELEFPKAGERVRVIKPGRRVSRTPINQAMHDLDRAVFRLPEIYRDTLLVEYCEWYRRPGDEWNAETKAAKLGIKARTMRDRLHIAHIALVRHLYHAKLQDLRRGVCA